jgi:hypothetical protein
MGTPPSTIDTVGAVLLLGWAAGMWAAVAVVSVALRRPFRRRWVLPLSYGVIGLGVLGQLGHVQEHFAQVGYWAIHPQAQPWMTPWGTALADGLGVVDPMKPQLGMEILHFVGNLIFLAGIVGVAQVTRHAYGTKARRWGRMGVWMQGLHGVEHLVLMASVWLGAPRAIGLSTWVGLMPPGPGLWTYRVWWHLIANVVGTVIFAIALWHLWRERREVAASWATTSRRASVSRPPTGIPSPRSGRPPARTPSAPDRAAPGRTRPARAPGSP